VSLAVELISNYADIRLANGRLILNLPIAVAIASDGFVAIVGARYSRTV